MMPAIRAGSPKIASSGKVELLDAAAGDGPGGDELLHVLGALEMSKVC